MKKFVALALALVLVFSMGVPSFGVTIDESGVFAPDKSAVDYYTQTVYSDLNILEAIRVLLQSTARELHTFVNRLDSGFFSVFDGLKIYFYDSVENVNGLGNGNLGDMMSTFAFLGREIQGMNYFTPYSGGEATSLDEALNKNLLYIQNQLQVILDSMGATSASSGLMSGWTLSAGSAPEGFSTSWYYRIHQNLFSLSNSITRLYGGNWADSENYGNSFFYKTYMQNYELVENSTSLHTLLADTTYQQYNPNLMPVNNANWFNAINCGLFALCRTLINPGSFSYYDYLNDKTVTSSPTFTSGILRYMSEQTSLLTRLAYVFADDEELEFKDNIAEDKTMILDMAIGGTDKGFGFGSSSVGFLKTLSGFDSFLVNEDFDISDIFVVFEHDDKTLLWFSSSVENDLDSSVSTFSRDNSNVVVTSFYDDRKAEFDELLGGLMND